MKVEEIIHPRTHRAWKARLAIYTAIVVTISLAAQAWVLFH